MALKRKIDPPRSFTPEQAQQWYKLLGAISEELGDTGLANTLFVDQVDGDNDTAERGSLTFKYATIQAAMDAALAGDTIWVTPGVYAENLVWADTNNITLRGTSKTSTSIVAAAGNAVTIAPTVALQLATITDIALTAAGLALSVDGTAVAFPGMFSDGLRMSDCLINNNATLVSVGGSVDFRDIEAGDADLTFTNCNGGQLLNSSWDAITIASTNIVDFVNYLDASGVECDVLTVNGMAKVRFSKDTRIGSIVGALIDTAVSAGYIEALGWIAGNTVTGQAINISFDLQNIADADVCTFDFAKIGGTVTIGDVGTSAVRGQANFRSAELLDQVGPHTAGDLCDMDLRGALFSQASLAVAGTGAIDRSVWIQTVPAGNTATPVAWANAGGPVPFVTAPEHVTHECAAAAEMPIAITTKSASQVAYTKGGVGGDATNVVVCAFKDYLG